MRLLRIVRSSNPAKKYDAIFQTGDGRIARLQTTYASDSLIVAQLQVLVERIEQATCPVQKNNAML